MQKINFQDLPNTDTPYNANTFNTLQDNIEDAINEMVTTQIYNNIFPIGRGFIDFTNTDYSNYLGFTWERELVGVTPIGYNPDDEDFNTIGKTMGEKTHTLTIDEMPSHNHGLNIGVNTGSGTLNVGYGVDYYSGNRFAQPNVNNLSSGEFTGWGTVAVGNNQPHNIIQPSKVVAYWKRVA